MTELQIQFNEKIVMFDDGNSWDKFRTFSPTGLVPCLLDGDMTVWESLAIVEYLAERHPEVLSDENAARAWSRSATAEMHAGFTALRNDCPMTVGLRIKLYEHSDALMKELDRLTELWNQGLERFGGPFLAGTFNAVDAFFAPVVFRLQTYGLSLEGEASEYATRILNLSGMQNWQESALAETWREPSHEKEIQALGEQLADLRVKP